MMLVRRAVRACRRELEARAGRLRDRLRPRHPARRRHRSLSLVAELTDPVLEMIRPDLAGGAGAAGHAVVRHRRDCRNISSSSMRRSSSCCSTLRRACRARPITRIRAARCLGATDYQLFLKVILPSAVPYILTGMRIALGFSFMGIVAAELIGAREGIGFLIMNSQMLMQTGAAVRRAADARESSACGRPHFPRRSGAQHATVHAIRSADLSRRRP